ncbi:MAG: D-glycero-beta-D-manno-heptose 1-phosphate adenylyltransferase [Planctomycetota bacterium]
MDQLLASLSRWKPFKAVVIGDFMLDQLLFGDADRLSGDAPVPVLRVNRTEDRPGGAANLCLNLVALRGRVETLGVIGSDEEGIELRRALLQQGVDASTLVTDPGRPTTQKKNLIGLAQGRHAQKMFRLDIESREPIGEATQAKLLAGLEKSIDVTDVVCIEDYNKGVCTPELCQRIIERARKAGKPVLVDPAGHGDFEMYKGATVITPNRTEAERAIGRSIPDDDPDATLEVAIELRDRLEVDAIVLTLDREGALLVNDEHPRGIPVPTVAREVYDVTGAGDMMLAGLAAARANKLNWVDSVRYANAAAGLEVEVFGVMPIAFERVHDEILRRHTSNAGKLRTRDEALIQVAAARKQAKRVVFTNGCFDVLHAGHVALLDAARQFGDMLVVGLNSDDSVKRLKGEGRPVNTQEDRARVLASLGCVDAVVLFEEDTPIRLIEAIIPDVLVKGADYTGKDVVGSQIVTGAGGRVELVDLVEGRSTTSTLEKIRGD